MKPTISVVMSVYNGEQYLREAIDSILKQTYKDFEFIIIDDGSKDNSSEILKSYHDPRIILIQQENKGLPASLNKGIKIARGEYIVRMDADDVSHYQRIEKQFYFLEKNSKCVAVGSNADIIDKDGEYLYTSSQPIETSEIIDILPQSPFFHSAVMFRKAIAAKCNFYYEKMVTSQDIVLFNQMARYGDLRNLKDALIKYRIVPFALSTNTKKAWEGKKEIINNAIMYGKISDEDAFVLKNIRTSQSRRYRLGNYYLRIGMIYIIRNFQKKKAIKNLFLSLFYYPINIRTWAYLILTILPPFFIKRRIAYLNNKSL